MKWAAPLLLVAFAAVADDALVSSSTPTLDNNTRTPLRVDTSGNLKISGTTTSSSTTGAAADGAAVSGNPVRIAGKDGSGNTQDILTDTSGNLSVGSGTAGTAAANVVTVQGIASMTPLSVQVGIPVAADIIAGYQSFTSTTAATTIVTIPAGETWVGTITASCATAIAAASATAGQALGVITTVGAGTTPAAGTYLDCDARAGANAATGTVGSSSSTTNQAVDFYVNCASGTCTLACTSTNAGTFSRVSCSANGRLL